MFDLYLFANKPPFGAGYMFQHVELLLLCCQISHLLRVPQCCSEKHRKGANKEQHGADLVFCGRHLARGQIGGERNRWANVLSFPC